MFSVGERLGEFESRSVKTRDAVFYSVLSRHDVRARAIFPPFCILENIIHFDIVACVGLFFHLSILH